MFFEFNYFMIMYKKWHFMRNLKEWSSEIKLILTRHETSPTVVAISKISHQEYYPWAFEHLQQMCKCGYISLDYKAINYWCTWTGGATSTYMVTSTSLHTSSTCGGYIFGTYIIFRFIDYIFKKWVIYFCIPLISEFCI